MSGIPNLPKIKISDAKPPAFDRRYILWIIITSVLSTLLATIIAGLIGTFIFSFAIAIFYTMSGSPTPIVKMVFLLQFSIIAPVTLVLLPATALIFRWRRISPSTALPVAGAIGGAISAFVWYSMLVNPSPINTAVVLFLQASMLAGFVGGGFFALMMHMISR